MTLEPQAALWICVCGRPRWKIADGNDLLRGLVKKKLLDDLRKKDLTITNQFINPQNLEQIFELPLKH